MAHCLPLINGVSFPVNPITETNAMALLMLIDGWFFAKEICDERGSQPRKED
jgi:hypothetical protein